MQGSWKTTLGGCIVAVGGVLQLVEEPAWVKAAGASLIAFGGLFTGLNARDNKVSSESAGAK